MIDIYRGPSEEYIHSNETQLLTLWQRGIEDPSVVGYHSTSLETILYSIRYGSFPGHTEVPYDDPELPQRGDIYFAPRMATFPFGLLPDLLSQDMIRSMDEFGLRESRGTAISRAVGYRACDLLGLPAEKYGLLVTGYLNDRVVRGENRGKLFDMGFTRDELIDVISKAKKRRGIVVTLKREALDTYPLSTDDSGTGFRLSTGILGLPLRFLAGLEALGEEERQFFEDLAYKHGIR